MGSDKSINTSPGAHNTTQHDTTHNQCNCDAGTGCSCSKCKAGSSGNTLLARRAAPRSADLQPRSHVTATMWDHLAQEKTQIHHIFFSCPFFFSSACVCFSPRSVTLQLMICNGGMEAVKLSLILTPAASAVFFFCFFKENALVHFLMFPTFFLLFSRSKESRPPPAAVCLGFWKTSPAAALQGNASPFRHDGILETVALSRPRSVHPAPDFGPAASLAQQKKHLALTALNMNQPLRCLGLLAEVDFSIFFPHHQLLVVSL